MPSSIYVCSRQVVIFSLFVEKFLWRVLASLLTIKVICCHIFNKFLHRNTIISAQLHNCTTPKVFYITRYKENCYIKESFKNNNKFLKDSKENGWKMIWTFLHIYFLNILLGDSEKHFFFRCSCVFCLLDFRPVLLAIQFCFWRNIRHIWKNFCLVKISFSNTLKQQFIEREYPNNRISILMEKVAQIIFPLFVDRFYKT